MLKALLAAVVVVLGAGAAQATWSASSTGASGTSTDALSTPAVLASTNLTTSSGSVNWTPDASWQAAATFTATASASGHTSRTCSAAGSAGTCDLTGLDAGTAYALGVVATLSSWTSATGTGSLTTASAVPNFALTPAAGPYVAGAAFNVTVQARLGAANDSSYTGTKTLTISDPDLAPDGTTGASLVSASVTFDASGLGTASVRLFKAMAGNTFTLADGARTGSASVTVVPGAAARYGWTGVTHSAGTRSASCLFTCTVTALANNGTFTARASVTDTSGNVVSNLGAAQSVSVTTPTSGAGSGGSFTSPSAGTSVSLTIPASGAATSSATFTFRAQNGNWTTNTFSAQSVGGTAYTASTATVTKQ